jgi:hypothetical protein
MSSTPHQQQSDVNTALATRETSQPAEQSQFMPAMSIQQAVERHRAISAFVKQVMKPEVDYGKIPGAGEKLNLLKPGAEKLCTLFGLSKRFTVAEKIEDWSGDEHNGEPFFYYLYRCHLYRGDLLVAESDGSCNSFESKYRYRNAGRTCPQCGAAAIIKGKEEYGGGWVCFKKKEGCGAKFPDGDQQIEGQAAGKVANPDVCDQVNTIQKMAQKRALVAATLLAVNASDFFTQDVEDGVIEARPEPRPVNQQPQRAQQPRRQNGGGEDSDEAERLRGLVDEMAQELGYTAAQLTFRAKRDYGATGGVNSLSVEQLKDLHRGLSSEIDERNAS